MDCPGISQWKQHHQPVKEARRGWNTLAVTFVHYIFQLLLLLAHLYAVRSLRFKWNEFEVDGYRAWSWTCITFIGLVTANHFPFALDAGAAQYLFLSRQTDTASTCLCTYCRLQTITNSIEERHPQSSVTNSPVSDAYRFAMMVSLFLAWHDNTNENEWRACVLVVINVGMVTLQEKCIMRI